MTEAEKRAQLVLRSARSWLGTPYLHQASKKGIGCDCLGLIRGVWRDVMGAEPEKVPAYSNAWAEVDPDEKLLTVAEKYFETVDSKTSRSGDVVVFRLRRNAAAKHAGILSGARHFIHAYDGHHVLESAMSPFWRHRIAAVFRFPAVGDAG